MPCVLIVDDDAIVREPMAAALREAGFETATAATGAEAIACILRQRPDLVLLDLAMPVMDGFGTLRRIRHMFDSQQVPVIVLTSAADSTSALAAAAFGVTGYMSKRSFTLSELLANVTAALQNRTRTTATGSLAPGR